MLFIADQTRLGVWILDGDSYHANLLSFAQSTENFEDSLVVLVASMSAPWSIMESLQRWTEVLNNHINRLRIPPEKMQLCEEKCKLLCLNLYANYIKKDSPYLQNDS